MKKYRLLTTIFLILFLAGGSFHFFKESRQGIKDLAERHKDLRTVLPDARSFSDVQDFSKTSGVFPYYKAYRSSAQTDDDLVGYAFFTTDIVPEILGYAGPIELLIGIDPRGRITKVRVLSHSETTSYISKMGSFLQQFSRKGIKDPIALGVDIDGISRATITSDAVTRAVSKSLKEIGPHLLHSKAAVSVSKEKALPLDEIFVPLILFGIAVAGALTHKQNIRRIALAGGFLYFGIIKSTMLSAAQIVNICLLKFPPFDQSPLWYMLIGLTFLSTLLFGMVFCGSLCPFAAVEEFFFKLTHRTKKIKERALSNTIDQQARYIKYAILFSIIALSAFLGNSSATGIEPFLTLFTLNGTSLEWSLLSFMLVIAFFHFRFWCKYLCPVGACLGLFARFSLYKIRLGENCSQCAACDKICPTRAIRIGEAGSPIIDYPECILCGKCVTVCPKEKLRSKGPQEKDEQ